MSILTYKQNEIDRINFIKNRDGESSAIEFSLNGIREYRKLLFTRAGREIRIQLICSIIVYKRYITEYNTQKKINVILSTIANNYYTRTNNINLLGSTYKELQSILPELLPYLKL